MQLCILLGAYLILVISSAFPKLNWNILRFIEKKKRYILFFCVYTHICTEKGFNFRKGNNRLEFKHMNLKKSRKSIFSTVIVPV